MEIKRIETYSLYEFCQAVQQSVIEGWRFDFESNDLFPTAFGSMLVTGMVKKPEVKQVVLSEDNPQVLSEVNTQDNQVKRGRKPKE
jgi:hypothetical protein